MTDKAAHIALYPSDWLAGTRGLTPAETGVYITLVCMMYERQSPLPFDHARLARMCNCPAGTFRKILAVLLDERKLIETPDGLWQQRVEREIASAKDAIETASERGRKAVNARWNKSKQQSDGLENATVKPQSVEQKYVDNDNEKLNKNNKTDIRENCPSNTNQNQRVKEEEGGGRARDPDPSPSLVSKLTHALGFDHHGTIPKYWISPDTALIVGRWKSDLGLTDDEIITVAVGNMRQYGEAALGPITLNRAMKKYAAAKNAPPLTPEQSHGQSPQQNRKLSNADAQRLAIDVAGRTRKAPEPDWL